MPVNMWILHPLPTAPCSRESVLALSAAPPCWPTFAHQSCTAVRPGPRHTGVSAQWLLQPIVCLSVLSCFCSLYLPMFHCTCAWCIIYCSQSKKPRSATAYVCKLIKRRPTQGYVLCTHPPKKSALQRQRTRPTFGTWSAGGRKTPRIIESRRSLNLLPILNVHNWSFRLW